MNSITRPQPETVELLRSLEEIIQQMEAEGCPDATAAQLRELIQIALAQSLAESKRRDFLFRQIKQNIKRLRRSPLDFPDETRDALLNIEEYASQLPEKHEQKREQWMVEETRAILNGL